MTRFAIDRKNRDRKGGHEHTPIRKGPWAGADMKVARSIIKRYDKRLLRRQHNKAIAEGMQEIDQIQRELIEVYLDENWYDDSYHYNEWLNGYDNDKDIEKDPYGSYEGYDDVDPYNGLDTCDDPFCIQCSEERNYRPRSHARIQDLATAEHLAEEVQRGMVSLDLEVIENRDAGKTLGELLRERLSRPF